MSRDTSEPIATVRKIVLSRMEQAALNEIGRWHHRSPFYWRTASMAKLTAHGLVEEWHPERFPKGWRITDAGREVLNGQR